MIPALDRTVTSPVPAFSCPMVMVRSASTRMFPPAVLRLPNTATATSPMPAAVPAWTVIVPVPEVSIVSAASRNTIAPVDVRRTTERSATTEALSSKMSSIAMDTASNVSGPLPDASSADSVSSNGPVFWNEAPVAPPFVVTTTSTFTSSGFATVPMPPGAERSSFLAVMFTGKVVGVSLPSVIAPARSLTVSPSAVTPPRAMLPVVTMSTSAPCPSAVALSTSSVPVLLTKTPPVVDAARMLFVMVLILLAAVPIFEPVSVTLAAVISLVNKSSLA